ncbi:MAG: PAS domain-containing protein [Bryobacteraceae bacterium]
MKNVPTDLSELPDLVFVDAATRVEQAEAALQQERSISSAILDTVPALVVVLDADFKIVRFSRSCELSTGYVFGDVKDKEVWPLFFADEDADVFRAALQRLRGNVRSRQFESYWRKQDGFPLVISWTVTALFDDAAAIRFIIATGIDVTENKRLENAVVEISGRESGASARICTTALANISPVLHS